MSNSYGGSEWSGELRLDPTYNHRGVAITASAGDSGYGTEYPAASPYVTAVGGTSLDQATNTGTRNATETVWSGTGSGCSGFEPKPAWQRDGGCTDRTVADVAAVADPNTGVWVYDTYSAGGWAIFGGTSVAAPIIGSMYALAGNHLGTDVSMNSDPYSDPSALFDITSGSNGTCGTYLCTAAPGYDGPSGLGSPNGVAAFTNAVGTAPDFSLTTSSSALTMTRGGVQVSDTLTLSAISGYHATVRLAVSGLPRGLNASFTPRSLTPTGTSKLTLQAGMTTARGTYPLVITATGSDGTQHTLVVQATVQ
ncbi:MAG: hypothetical protein JO057_15480 [Chloroflexi bacterium]|nr:hypothetical protein [Chloroflexota bacterium]